MTEEAQTTVVEPEQKKQLTEYVVLSKNDDDSWTDVGRQSALSARAVVSAYLELIEDKAGVYVAVPTRSFQPITVKVETQTKLKFG